MDVDRGYIDLTTIDWFQTISNNSPIDPPGMTMRAKCNATHDENDLQLTSKERLTDIPITVSFAGRDAPPVRGNGQPLERGIGLFNYLELDACAIVLDRLLVCSCT